jgi:CheY-specific phosphatase CheX
LTASTLLDECLRATLDATAELAKATLGVELTTTASDAYELPPKLTGCCVALVGEAGSLQIGFASHPAGCQTFAKILFASNEVLPEEDVSDALGEIANIIAGGVKKRMVSGQPPLAIGLPIVMEGHIRLTERQRILDVEVKLGEVPVRLFIIGNK